MPKQGPREWSPRGEIPGEPIWPEFVDSYLETALWASHDETGLPFDETYSIDDFAQEAIDETVKEANDFIRANLKDLESVGDPDRHGHDFWLSRNGHGAGFFDRGYGEVGKHLQRNARAYGELHVYTAGDGKLYFE